LLMRPFASTTTFPRWPLWWSGSGNCLANW
jgi:hypothetical protein